MEQLSTAVQPVNTWHSADSSIAPDGGDVTGRRPRARGHRDDRSPRGDIPTYIHRNMVVSHIIHTGMSRPERSNGPSYSWTTRRPSLHGHGATRALPHHHAHHRVSGAAFGILMYGNSVW